METLTSCRIVPKPLFTPGKDRRSRPIFLAVSCACSGVVMSGSVPISMSGMPSRSKRYVFSAAVSEIILQASSSREILEMRTSPALVFIFPFRPTSAVRWNPEVLEPSTTVLRMTCTKGEMVALANVHNWSVVYNASLFISCGGSESVSTKQVVS